MTRPIPGVQSPEYRRDGQRLQRCSRCHAERSLSALVLTPGLNAADAMYPIMVGQDLVGVLCADCVYSTEKHIQDIFPDRHAFPFVDDRGRALPNPRCELGHPLVYAADGRSMVCTECDVMPAATRELGAAACETCGAAAGDIYHVSPAHDACPACLRDNARYVTEC